MAFGRDREIAQPSALPDWLKDFADQALKKSGGNPLDDIKNLFNLSSNSIDEKLAEMKERMGLDKLDKTDDNQIISTASLKSELLNEFSKLAEVMEASNNQRGLKAINSIIRRMLKTSEDLPQSLKDNPKLKIFIDNLCRSRGGHISIYSILKMIRDERPENVNLDEKLKSYIENKLKEEKQDIEDGDDELAGLGVGTTYNKSEEAEANKMFEPPQKDL